MTAGGDVRRGPGRPRKWASDAERMRAYRARKQAEREALERRAGHGELYERFQAATRERDALQREVNELRARVRALESKIKWADSSPIVPPPSTGQNTRSPTSELKPSRAERRRREREERKRRSRG